MGAEDANDRRRRRRAIALALLTAIIGLGVLFGTLAGVIGEQGPNPLTLIDNTTQYLTDGNWTDIYFDTTLQLGSGDTWQHPVLTVPQSAEFVSVSGGAFGLYFAINPTPIVTSMSLARATRPTTAPTASRSLPSMRARTINETQ